MLGLFLDQFADKADFRDAQKLWYRIECWLLNAEVSAVEPTHRYPKADSAKGVRTLAKFNRRQSPDVRNGSTAARHPSASSASYLK